MTRTELVEHLLQSEEPSIHWKVRVNVLGEERESAEIQALEAKIKDSPRVKALSQKVDKSGRLGSRR